MAASARDCVRPWVDAALPAPPQPLPAPPLELARALKDECYAAWSTAPARAPHCARLLQALRGADAQPEVAALAHWVQGVADLCAGRLADAGSALDAAHAAFLAIDRPDQAAQTRVPKLIVLSVLGRPAEAQQCAEDALAEFVALGDELAAGKVELNLGTMLSRQDRHAEAARLFRSAAVRAARAHDRDLSIRADIALASALTWLHDFDEALRINERARMRAQTHGLAVPAAMARGAIGVIELNRGHLHAALRELEAASRGFADAGASPQQCIEAEAALADAYLAVNLLPEAVALYGQVITQAQALAAPVEEARATLERARAHARSGQSAAALSGLAEARRLFEAQGNGASVAATDLVLAAVQLQAGQSSPALDSARRAVDALASSGMLGWQLEAQAMVAAALAARGEHDAAKAAFTQVLAQAQGLKAVQLACRRGLGLLAAASGDGAAARQHLGTALELVDEARVALRGDAFRTALGAETEALHDALLGVALADGDAPAALLALLEQGRARALALGLHDAEAAVPQREAAVPGDLLTRLQWARDLWRRALADGDADGLPALAAQVTELELAALEAHRRAQLAAPVAPDGAAAPPFTSAALQAALPTHTALLAYHRLGDRLIAVVATRDAVQHAEWDCAGLDESLAGLRFQIDGQRGGVAALQRHAALLAARTTAHLQALHGLVWGPVASLLGEAQGVVVVPHRELHYIPYAALHDGGRWLAERHEISLAPSASAWLAARRVHALPPQTALAVGYGGTALPHVADELRAVAAAFGAGGRVLEGAAATRAALREALCDTLPQAQLLHLACHGQFRADSPSFSSLELADGALTLLDAQCLPVAGRLVALSACETGLSRVAPGDELLGLVRGFLLAGAPTVLASLWRVDDAATAVLMRAFYTRLAAGARPAAALREAQLEQARRGAHPFLWAAFALHGDA